MVATMKEAVAMDFDIDGYRCDLSFHHPNSASLRAGRKERLLLSAISTPARGDSVWFGIEPYAALYSYGERREFGFELEKSKTPPVSPVYNVSLLGFSIQRNAHSVQCLRVKVQNSTNTLPFVDKIFSLDAWKEAFPSLRTVYLRVESLNFDLPPHLLKHVRGLDVYGSSLGVSQQRIRSLIRKKDYGIEEVKFRAGLPKHAELLDDMLRRVRSFEVELENEADLDDLAESLERTKADGDNLVRLRLQNIYARRRFLTTATVGRILRSRPNLQILNLDMVTLETFVVLCPAFASSILTTLRVGVSVLNAVHDKSLADGVEMLLQHPTIRDLDLTIQSNRNFPKTSQVEGDSAYHFERCVAEGLRSTSLRRFHLTANGFEAASDAVLTKMYENAKENWSLMDIRLMGINWFPWNEDELSRPLPFPLTAFDFISSRNQYVSRVLMLDENTLPPGLWPLILEWCPRWGHPWAPDPSILQLNDRGPQWPPTDDSCPLWKERYDESVLFYVLTLRPHLVKYSKVERSIHVDTEKSVDGPRPKRTRTT